MLFDIIQAYYDDKAFDNSYNALAVSGRINVPLLNNSFRFISTLLQSRYGGYNYANGSVSMQTASAKIMFLSDESEPEDNVPALPEYYVTFNSSYTERVPVSLTVDFPYIQNGLIQPQYYVYPDPFNHQLQYYYIPVQYTTQFENLIIQSGLGHVYIPSWTFEVPDVDEEITEQEEDNSLSFMVVYGVVQDADLDNRTNGLLIYEKKAVLDGMTVDGQSFIESAYYYDYKGRVIQTVERNNLGGISRYSTKYDFIGNVLTQCESHTLFGNFEQVDVN